MTNLPNGWRATSSGEICEYITSGSRDWRSYYSDHGPLFIRTQDINQDRLDLSEIAHVSLPDKVEGKRSLVQPGDLLVTITGANVGKVALVPAGVPEAYVSQSVGLMRLKDKRIGPYLHYYLQSDRTGRKHVMDMVYGIGRPVLSLKNLREIPVFLPSLDEQQRIVAEIEKQFTRLDAGVASLKRVQSALKRYRASVLKAACEGRLVPTEAELAAKENRNYETGEQLLERILKERREKWNGKGKYKEPVDPNVIALPKLPDGWTWCMSDALFTFVTSGSRGWAKYHSQTGPLFLRIGNLNHQDIRLDVKDIQHVDPPKGAEGTRTVVQSGDILVSITADIGMIAVVPENLGEAYINQHVALARPTASIFTEYVAHYLSASEGGWRHLKKLQRGATKVGLGLNDIRSVPIPLPPLAEQKRIVTELERRLSVIEELEVIISTELQRAARLRQSILAAAFCGARRLWEKVLLAETDAKVHT